jgi:hypothetical protein
MLEARQRLIDLATRPLAGNQAASDLAQGELMDRLAHARPADVDDSLGVATRRLERKSAPPAWRIALGFAAALALLGAILSPLLRAAWEEMKELNPLYRFFSPHYSHLESWEQRITAGLDADQRLFLLANTNGVGQELQAAWMKAAAKRLPEDPGEFEEFLTTAWTSRSGGDLLYGRTNSELLEHGRRIDPGNGLWDLTVAEMKCRTALKGWPSVKFLNRPDYESAWIGIGRAAASPRFESHIPERTLRRLEMLAPATDLASMVSRKEFASRQRSSALEIEPIALWLGRAAELESDGDREQLAQWFAAWENLTHRRLESGLIQPGGFNRISAVAYRFVKPATSLGMTEEAARMDRWEKSVTTIATRPGAVSGGPRRHASIIATGSINLPASDAELEPGRRAEFAVADRFFALVVACLFTLLGLFAALESWRRPLEIRGLAGGLFPLLRPVDFAWLAGLGLALPFAWHVVIVRFTPLGCRDFALTEWDMIPSLAQAGGSFLFATCLLVQTARWRISRRAGFLALRPPGLGTGWLMAFVAALFVAVIGGVRELPKWQEEFLVYGSAVAGIPLLWLLWRGGAIAFGPRAASLGGVLTCRLLFPFFLIAAGGLLALMPLLKIEERRWVARDTVGGTDPAGSGFGVLAARLYSDIRQQLLEAVK